MPGYPDSRRSESGLALPEILIAGVLLAIGLLGMAPMFVYAMHGNAAGGDMGRAGTVAVERLELLRSDDYAALVPGGNLQSNVAGYFTETSEVTVRWSITSNANPPDSKRIAVRAIPRAAIPGPHREVDLVTLRGK